MKRIRIGILLVGVFAFLLAGCAAQKPNWQELVKTKGIDLTYHLKKGDKATYRTISTNDVSQEMMGQTQEFSTTTRAVVHYEVKDVQKDGNFVVEAAIDSLTIKGSNPALAQVQGILDKAKNKTVTLIVTPKGKVSSIKGLKAFPTVQGFGRWGETFKSLFLHLPAKAVKVGESWDDTDERQAGSGPLKITVKSKRHYTLKGITLYKNRPCLNIPFTGDLNLSGKGNQAGMELEFSGTGSFTGKVYFDPATSSYLLMTSENSTDGSVKIPSRNMEIPNTITTSVKVERIK